MRPGNLFSFVAMPPLAASQVWNAVTPNFLGVVATPLQTYLPDGMNTPANEGLWSLTEKEKQTLRLLVRGHAAKSVAGSLGLSVHTINERLRDARRKMAVSSSREAARLLLEAEGGDAGRADPKLFADTGFGEDATRTQVEQGIALNDGAGPAKSRPWIIIGVLLMIFAFGLFALAALPQAASTPTPPLTTDIATAPNTEVADAARRWLVLLDQGRWEESYRATGTPFRKLNTVQAWAAASERVRTPLGAMISRTAISQENLPAPPAGYEVMKFRTRFANKADAVETVTLDREDGRWRVVGVTVG
jgi:DNA-binding CsgD family transcriptional regulator